MRTLYITDLDGTLLNDDARVSETSARILSDLSRKGALISVATARTPATVEPLFANVYTTTPLVVMTGAALWNRERREFIGMRYLPQNQAETILSVFRNSPIHPFCYTLKDPKVADVYHYAPELTASENKFYSERADLALKRFHLATEPDEASMSQMVLYFAMGSEKDIVDVASRLKDCTDCYVSYYKDTYTPDLWLIEIFANGVSKAAGIQRLKELVGAERVVAFGDNLNDIVMLREADLAVVVENGLDAAKQYAHIIIGNNNDDSVARFIENDFYNYGK